MKCPLCTYEQLHNWHAWSSAHRRSRGKPGVRQTRQKGQPMSTQKYRDKSGTVVNAMQFNGLDDYLTIVTWMKAYGDTYARAGEVTYATPEMSLQTAEGRMSARPGDWIVLTGLRFTVCRANEFATSYAPVDADS